MPLTFEDAGFGNHRRWQCFVCGHQYDDYETYKEHITDTHEEGREYIKCPDCSAPVRDLKMHYRTKHPKRIMPNNVQTRVAVWYDCKREKDGKNKRVARKGFNNRQGTFTSKKNGKDFEYKSGLECEFFECLEEDVDVESFAYETIKIPYFWKGEWHNYIPDIRVNFIDGTTQIWEIKPANQTQYEQNKAKWAAANNYCSNLGWDFVVLTEVGLGKMKSKLKRQGHELNKTS
jgi:rubredoxin